MAIKILHTADWHIGQRFFDYERTKEHQAFFDWLISIIEQRKIDVLLISGDIFDVANPSSDAQKLYYSFLHQLTSVCLGIQVVIIAGNHDSPSRLEAPSSFLSEFNIRVIGSMNKSYIPNKTQISNEECQDNAPLNESELSSLFDQSTAPENTESIDDSGCLNTVINKDTDDLSIDNNSSANQETLLEISSDSNDPFILKHPESFIIPLKKKNTNDVAAYCLAVPYLRPGDYPIFKKAANPYEQGVKKLYQDLYDACKTQMIAALPVVAMGHLHVASAALSDSERGIRGGLEMIKTDTFPAHLSYVALGHIHKSQRINEQENIRYAGSPIPMSFSEINYQHGVYEIDIADDGTTEIIKHIIPRLIPLLRIGSPSNPLEKEKVLEEIDGLESRNEFNQLSEEAPFLEINISLPYPDPLLNQEITTALASKYVRLAKTQIYYPSINKQSTIQINSIDQIREMSPYDLFSNYYQNKYGQELPQELKDLFNEVLSEI